MPAANIEHWMQATRDIYTRMQNGQDKTQAHNEVLGDWDMKEKTDYETWLRFYQEKTPEKYPKLASLYESPEVPGYVLPNPIGFNNLRSRIPNPISNLEKEIPGTPQQGPTDVSNVNDTIEAQRRKIISRLNSAEKLLSTSEGYLFAGDKLEDLLKTLHDLKLKIQISNKRTVRSSLFEDYIYKEANILSSQGFLKEAAFLEKIAQMPDLGLGGSPGVGFDLGGGPDMSTSLPGTSEAPSSDNAGAKEETINLLREFFDNLQNGISDKRDQRKERRRELRENRKNKTSSYLDDDIIVLAQEGPEVKTPPVMPAPVVPSVSDPSEQKPPANEDKTEDLIDAALRTISIHDVIKRLEMLVKVYNQREISRQLAILDIMMDRAGLASFFPSLGEAMGKALESNQYIATRLSDILTKLKGSLGTSGEEWIAPREQEYNPETEQIKQNLTQQQEEEDRKRELRKQRDMDRLEGKEKGLVGEQLAAETAPVAPPGPTVPPPPPADVPNINTPAKIERSQPIQAR
jgi:hypothetical protein